MKDKLEKLKQEKALVEKRLRQEQNKLQRLENRKKYFEQGERSKRTHRLCVIGGTVEAVAPEIKEVQQPQLYELLEFVFSLPEARAALAKCAERGRE